MRIKETHTSPGVEVLKDKVPKEGALAQASLPDDIQVLRPVFRVEQHEFGLVRDPIRAGADSDRGVFHRERRPTSLPLPMGSQCPPHREDRSKPVPGGPAVRPQNGVW
jgi:hypothetical protein